VLLFILCFVIPIYIEIKIMLNTSIKQLYIGFGFFKRKHFYKIKIPLTPKYLGIFSLKRLKKYKRNAQNLESRRARMINYIISRSNIESLYIKAHIGLEDAGITAIICGFFITVSELILQYVHNNMSIESIQREIYPIYNKNYIDIDIDCIMWMRTGYIINMAIRIISSNIIKAVKNRWQINIQ